MLQIEILCGEVTRTDFTVQILLFHLSHKVDLVENLQPVGRGDLTSYILTSVSQLVSCYSMAVLQFTEDMDEKS